MREPHPIFDLLVVSEARTRHGVFSPGRTDKHLHPLREVAIKYALILFFAGPLQGTAVSTGPFDNLVACERAASQATTLNPHSRSICVALNAKPHHGNGKPLK